MDEIELTRRAFDDVPVTDEAAKARARARLRARISQEPSGPPGRGPGWPQSRARWLIAAAVIAGALVLQAVLPPDSGGPESSAAAELERLATVAAAASDVRVPDEALIYLAYEELRLEDGGAFSAEHDYRIMVRASVESWRAADGAFRRTTLVRSVEFPTPGDRAAWLAAGSPPTPAPGNLERERYGPGELTFVDLSMLPTDPDELRRRIESGGVVPYEPGLGRELLVIGYLLAQADASPDLRSALFQVAATVPSVELLDPATDPLGRRGVGVVVGSGDSQIELIFDPETSELLASIQRPVQGGLSLEPSAWQAFTASGVVDT